MYIRPHIHMHHAYVNIRPIQAANLSIYKQDLTWSLGNLILLISNEHRVEPFYKSTYDRFTVQWTVHKINNEGHKEYFVSVLTFSLQFK